MSTRKIEEALKLLEQAKFLLVNHPNPNLEKCSDYLRETIRCLKERR